MFVTILGAIFENDMFCCLCGSLCGGGPPVGKCGGPQLFVGRFLLKGAAIARFHGCATMALDDATKQNSKQRLKMQCWEFSPCIFQRCDPDLCSSVTVLDAVLEHLWRLGRRAPRQFNRR